MPALLSSRAMRQIRSLLLALTPLVLFLVTAQTALAQDPSPEASPTPEAVAKGICAPWHRCLAMGALGLTALLVVVFGIGYLVQRRGFEKLEHRQGNPEGIKAD